MKSRTFALCVSISLSAQGLAGSDPEQLSLKPNSAWQVDYSNDACRLGRQFGEGDERIFALFERFGPEEAFRLTLAGKPVKTSVTKGLSKVQFGPSEAEQQLLFFQGDLQELPALVFVNGIRVAPLADAELAATMKTNPSDFLQVAPISDDRLKAIKYLKVGKPLRRTVVLETGSLRAPFAALDKCLIDLMTQWGIDVERHKNLTKRALPLENPGKWILSSDYPSSMLRAGQPALIEFRLNVDSEGKPTSCYIQSTTRPKDFDDAVCKSVMRRARFSPALDADGKPLATFYRNRVLFQIP